MSRRLAVLVSFPLVFNGVAGGQARGRPAPLRGVLAPTVDSVLRAHSAVICYRLPLATQTGDLEWKMNGCHVFAGDTLFYFYLGDDGRVWAWGHDWHVSDST